MNVVWTETAVSQLEGIREYIARTSPGYARALTLRIIKRTEQLSHQPFLGYVMDEYDNLHIRELIEHPYRIIYHVADDAVQILAIVHAARQLPKDPKFGQ